MKISDDDFSDAIKGLSKAFAPEAFTPGRDVVNVYPRQALEAERVEDFQRWEIWLSNGDFPGADFTDAEFAAHFRDAERLDALIEAARNYRIADEEAGATHGLDAELVNEWEARRHALFAALRAYDEGQEQ